jgi:threonine/homoserine/homoserine lactone efflux protein
MWIILFIKGTIIGFALALPIGPIGITCIRKTITEGRLHGLIVGLGGATADLIYSCIAAFGITNISNEINNHRFWIRLAGGIFLFTLGIITYLTKPKEHKLHINSKEIFKLYFFTLLLSFTNPLTIFAFIAVFALIGIGTTVSFYSLCFLVIGIFAGSSSWFLILTWAAKYYGKKFNKIWLQKINKILGILILISGIIAIMSVL